MLAVLAHPASATPGTVIPQSEFASPSLPHTLHRPALAPLATPKCAQSRANRSVQVPEISAPERGALPREQRRWPLVLATHGSWSALFENTLCLSTAARNRPRTDAGRLALLLGQSHGGVTRTNDGMRTPRATVGGHPSDFDIFLFFWEANSCQQHELVRAKIPHGANFNPIF